MSPEEANRAWNDYASLFNRYTTEKPQGEFIPDPTIPNHGSVHYHFNGSDVLAGFLTYVITHRHLYEI